MDHGTNGEGGVGNNRRRWRLARLDGKGKDSSDSQGWLQGGGQGTSGPSHC